MRDDDGPGPLTHASGVRSRNMPTNFRSGTLAASTGFPARAQLLQTAAAGITVGPPAEETRQMTQPAMVNVSHQDLRNQFGR